MAIRCVNRPVRKLSIYTDVSRMASSTVLEGIGLPDSTVFPYDLFVGGLFRYRNSKVAMLEMFRLEPFTENKEQTVTSAPDAARSSRAENVLSAL